MVSGCSIPIRDREALKQLMNKIPPNNIKGDQQHFVDREISNLLEMQVIEISVHEQDEIISPIFLVDKPDGSYRLILNLKKFNEWIEYEHFKMEHFSFTSSLVRKNCFMASVDLRHAYYSVPVHQTCRKYLKFMWKGTLYNFTCLPNGLSSAPRYFTKLLKPVYANLRSQGFISSYFLDDCYLQGDTYEKCAENIEKTVNLFSKLGFVVHPKKSILKPVQKIKFLGFLIDSTNMTISLDIDKKEKIKKACQDLLNTALISLRTLARVIGLLVASFPAVLWGKLYFRKLEAVKKNGLVKNRGNFDAYVMLTKQAVDELTWWIENIDSAYYPLNNTLPDITIQTDSSSVGYGIACEGEEGFGGKWNDVEQKLHINVLEMKAIEIALKSFQTKLKNKHVKIMCDNTTAICYLQSFGGSKSMICNDIANRIWAWCKENNMWLTICFIPSKLNSSADFWSRHFDDSKEWMLNKSTFNDLTQKFNIKPAIDLFASHNNAQLENFVSWGPDPKAAFTDAFSIFWGNNIVYGFPPFSLILKTLKKVEQDGAMGLFIFPHWTTAMWFPMMMRLKIGNLIILPPARNILRLPGTDKIHPMKSLRLLAVILKSR